MQQALHILKKDIQFLRYEVAGMFFLSLLYPSGLLGLDALLVIGAILLISRVIHADTIPGDRQFWLTRPYKRTSLLSAKILFIVLCVNLPVFIGRLSIVLVDGLPILPSLPGLLWTQLWLLLAVGLPIAALAAVTTGITQFLFSMLTLYAVGMGLTFLVRLGGWFPAFQWIQDGLVILALIAMGSAICYAQYSGRHTTVSRIIAVSGLLVVGGLYFLLPTSIAKDVQPRFSPFTMDPAVLQIQSSAAVTTVPPTQIGRLELGERLKLDVDVTISNVPTGADVYLDEFSFTLTAPDGRSFQSSSNNLGRVAEGQRIRRSPFMFSVKANALHWNDSDFFAAEHDQPLQYKASALFALFGNPREEQAHLDRTPRNVIDDLQCYLSTMGRLQCRSVTELSNRMVTATSGSSTAPLRNLLSFAPIPLGLRLNPILEDGNNELNIVNGDVTIAVREPLGFVRRDFVIPNFRLQE